MCFPHNRALLLSRHDQFLFASIADNKGPAGKRTKTKNPAGASATMGNSSPEKTSASKDSGKNLSNYWLMKSEPESRLEKGVDVKVRLGISSRQVVFSSKK